MGTKLKATLFALAASVVATGAVAEERASVADSYRYYLGAGGGINIIPDSEARLRIGPPLSTTFNTTFDFDMGWAAAGTLGAYLPHAWRIEIEGAYRDNDIKGAPFSGGVFLPQVAPITISSTETGSLTGYSVMLNILKDIPTDSRLTPYIGGGAGYADRHLDITCAVAVPAGFCALDDHDHGLAYQGIAGLSFDVSQRLQLFADYRYFATVNFDYGPSTGPVNVRDLEDNNHTVLAGLRLAFGERAAPAPVAAPQPKNYLVFFDWDRSDLRQDAQEIVATAAKDAIDGKAVSLDVVGHADRSGTDEYNLGLSERRANTVKGELVRLGVPESAIQISWKGESEPLVATADGVREAQNRRASITINFGQ